MGAMAELMDELPIEPRTRQTGNGKAYFAKKVLPRLAELRQGLLWISTAWLSALLLPVCSGSKDEDDQKSQADQAQIGDVRYPAARLGRSEAALSCARLGLNTGAVPSRPGRALPSWPGT